MTFAQAPRGPEQSKQKPTTFLSKKQKRKCEKLWTLPLHNKENGILAAPQGYLNPNPNVGSENVSRSHFSLKCFNFIRESTCPEVYLSIGVKSLSGVWTISMPRSVYADYRRYGR
jgi:hypothetical protein